MSVATTREAQAYRSYIGSTVRLSIEGGSLALDGLGGRPSPLPALARFRVVVAGAVTYVRQGGPGISALDSPRVLLPGDELYFNTTDPTDNRIAVASANGAGGTAYITRVDALDGFAPGNAAVQKAQALAEFIGPTQKLRIDAGALSLAGLAHGGRFRIAIPVVDPTGMDGQPGEEAFVRQGSSSILVTADNGMPLGRGGVFYINVDDANSDAVSVIAAGAVSSVSYAFITRVDRAG